MRSRTTSKKSLILFCLAILAGVYFFWTSFSDTGLAKGPSFPIIDDEDEDDSDITVKDVEVPYPRVNFPDYAKYPAHNVNNPKKYAYATLFCTPEPRDRDPFFIAAQQLVWRILWSNWHSQYPIVVFVCPNTPAYQRKILAGQGAIVQEIDLISAPDPSQLHLSRWKDQLTKLNMWKYTEYEKMTFLDVDAFPIQNIDDLFDKVKPQNCKRNLLSDDDLKTLDDLTKADELCHYTFGGTVMSEDEGTRLNGGTFVFKPSRVWHAKLMRDLLKIDQYDIRTAEQGLLDSKLAFSLSGPFPRSSFTQDYNADKEYYADNIEEGTIKVIHCKMWSPFSVTWAPELSTRWDVDWMEMSRFYDSKYFRQARQTGHRKEALDILGESEARAARRAKAAAEAQ